MKKKFKADLKGEAGFSLVEIMVVLIIIGLILGVAGTKFMERLETAKVQTAKIQMRSFEQALDSYRLDNSRYPSTDQGLEALISKPSSPPVPKNYDSEGYLDARGDGDEEGGVPMDPWGNPYEYSSEAANKYRITSLGADAAPGGEGVNKDIVFTN